MVPLLFIVGYLVGRVSSNFGTIYVGSSKISAGLWWAFMGPGGVKVGCQWVRVGNDGVIVGYKQGVSGVMIGQ